MVKYGVSDQNKISWTYESGTYATTSGGTQWPGLVTAHDPGENLNVVPLRYVAGAGRNVNQFVQTSEEYDGTLTFHPQDWRFLKFALGSCADGGSPTPYQHNISENDSDDNCREINCQPLPSFQIEDTHHIVAGSNLQRTLKGCMIDTMTINAPEGDMMSVDLSYTAQQLVYGSGAATAVTAMTHRPFLAMDSRIEIGSPDIGPPYPNIKSWTLEVANNLSKPNYADGNKYRGKPIPTGRDYTLTVTLNEYSEQNKILYDKYFIGGSSFNTEIQIMTNQSGLGSTFFYMSGCELVDMGDPTSAEGENEVTLTIRPQSLTVTAHDNIQYWNAWSGLGF